jgi:alkaline phosphatase
MATTHSAILPVTDSAAAASALSTVHETNNDMIGVHPRRQAGAHGPGESAFRGYLDNIDVARALHKLIEGR